MRSLRKFIRIALGFSRKETNGFLILVPLMLLLMFSSSIYNAFSGYRDKDYSSEKALLDSLALLMEQNYSVAIMKDDPKPPGSTFRFNPNYASFQELLQLGFSARIASRLIKFRSSGGKFSIRKDVLSVYGLDSMLYLKLYPFIDLPETEEQSRSSRTTTTLPSPNAPLLFFDLNKSDTTELVNIKGIGSVLSSRIIKYRNVLGGFVSIGQLYEVYGLDSVVVDRLIASSFIDEHFAPAKLDLNKLNEDELSRHPYISKKIAKGIVAYRFQHGLFKSIEDIKRIQLIDESTFLKIEPYLTLN